jgi:Sec-independent protein secretion pathway component TatC
MSLLFSYFSEIQTRILYAAFSFLVAFIVSLLFSTEIIYLFTMPILSFDKPFKSTHLAEPFYATLKICSGVAFLTLYPLLVYHLWCFLLPSLFFWERKRVNRSFGFSTLLFYGFLFFAFFILIPSFVQFFFHYEIGAAEAALTPEGLTGARPLQPEPLSRTPCGFGVSRGTGLTTLSFADTPCELEANGRFHKAHPSGAMSYQLPLDTGAVTGSAPHIPSGFSLYPLLVLSTSLGLGEQLQHPPLVVSDLLREYYGLASASAEGWGGAYSLPQDTLKGGTYPTISGYPPYPYSQGGFSFVKPPVSFVNPDASSGLTKLTGGFTGLEVGKSYAMPTGLTQFLRKGGSYSPNPDLFLTREGYGLLKLPGATKAEPETTFINVDFSPFAPGVTIVIEPRIGPFVDWSFYILFFSAFFSQTPLIFLSLYRRGLLPPSFFYKNRRIGFFFLLMAAPLLSPPDFWSQFFLFLFFFAVYEIFIWACFFLEERGEQL